ncbi:hypothetical protein HSB1_42340 [Halogranum salarium B-1]|uniref:Uncharacterized protein n=1 Tax=Halogranum salarium B-1 TaxID=1210908 RepID=J3JDJ6_9EURY|nr:hypothetical protein HSB1_42340 [Halogranum salarium B-1]
MFLILFWRTPGSARFGETVTLKASFTRWGEDRTDCSSIVNRPWYANRIDVTIYREERP